MLLYRRCANRVKLFFSKLLINQEWLDQLPPLPLTREQRECIWRGGRRKGDLTSFRTTSSRIATICVEAIKRLSGLNLSCHAYSQEQLHTWVIVLSNKQQLDLLFSSSTSLGEESRGPGTQAFPDSTWGISCQALESASFRTRRKGRKWILRKTGLGHSHPREQDTSGHSIVLYQIPEPAPIAKLSYAEMTFSPYVCECILIFLM